MSRIGTTGWIHLGFSLLTEKSSHQTLLYSIMNNYQYWGVQVGLVELPGFVLGESYFGKMREFNLYKSYLGPESFDDPSLSTSCSL